MKKIFIILSFGLISCDIHNIYESNPIIIGKDKIDGNLYLYTYRGLGFSTNTFSDTAYFCVGDTIIGRKLYKK